MRVIFDNGHGGVIGGKYLTKGKRSPDYGKGPIYEGAWNRWLVNRLLEKLCREEVPFFHISAELMELSLNRRIIRANSLHRLYGDVYVLSIHSNAGGGTGIEAFTSIGETKSDEIADEFLKDLEVAFPEEKFRYDYRDGDRDKEKNFMILQETKCPAVLLELFFMDNEKDYHKLWSEEYMDAIVQSLYKTIVKLYRRDIFYGK